MWTVYQHASASQHAHTCCCSSSSLTPESSPVGTDIGGMGSVPWASHWTSRFPNVTTERYGPASWSCGEAPWSGRADLKEPGHPFLPPNPKHGLSVSKFFHPAPLLPLEPKSCQWQHQPPHETLLPQWPPQSPLHLVARMTLTQQISTGSGLFPEKLPFPLG